MRFAGLTTTVITPATYQIDNLGPDVQALTFKYAGKAHTINRSGKRNIILCTSFKNGTITVKNNVGEKMERMNVSSFDFVSILYTDGRIESNDYTAR